MEKLKYMIENYLEEDPSKRLSFSKIYEILMEIKILDLNLEFQDNIQHHNTIINCNDPCSSSHLNLNRNNDYILSAIMVLFNMNLLDIIEGFYYCIIVNNHIAIRFFV